MPGILPDRRLNDSVRHALAGTIPEPLHGFSAALYEARGNKAMHEDWCASTSAIQTSAAELSGNLLSAPHGRNPMPAGPPNSDCKPTPATMAVMFARMIVVGIRNSQATISPAHFTPNRIAAKRDRQPRRRTRQFISRRFPTRFRNMDLAVSRAGGPSRERATHEATKP